MSFDTDVFINELSVRRPLWDISLKDYSNRDVKSKLWLEVGAIVIEKWDQLTNEEKNKEVKDLQKKWKSLRDAFSREMRNQKMPSGSGVKRRKKYCYFDQLLFLVGTLDNGQSATSLEETQSTPHDDENNGSEEEGTPSAEQPNQPQPNQGRVYQTSSKRAKQPSFEAAVLRHLEAKQVDEDEEADRNFLLSFLPVFKKLSLEKKMWARVSITQVMHEAATRGTMAPPNYHPPYNQTGYYSGIQNQYQMDHFQQPFQGPQAPYARVVSPPSTSGSTSDASVFSVINDEDLTQLGGFGGN